MAQKALFNIRKFFPNVTSVVDATRSTKIEVTKKDASSRAVKNHKECAMAVACKRAFHVDGVVISRSVAYLVKGNQARRFVLPNSVIHEVISFDRGGGFAPGNYALSPPSICNKLGFTRDKTRLNPERDHTNQGRSKRHVTTNVRDVLAGQQPEED
jgi:hypothetical protein